MKALLGLFIMTLAGCGASNHNTGVQAKLTSATGTLVCQNPQDKDHGYAVHVAFSGPSFTTATVFQKKVFGLQSVAELNLLTQVDPSNAAFVFGQPSSGGFRVELSRGNIAGIRSAKILQRTFAGTTELASLPCTP